MAERAQRQFSKTQIYKAGEELVDDSDSNGEEIINDRLNMTAAMALKALASASPIHRLGSSSILHLQLMQIRA